jgi:hypothetical protein
MNKSSNRNEYDAGPAHRAALNNTLQEACHPAAPINLLIKKGY